MRRDDPESTLPRTRPHLFVPTFLGSNSLGDGGVELLDLIPQGRVRAVGGEGQRHDGSIEGDDGGGAGVPSQIFCRTPS